MPKYLAGSEYWVAQLRARSRFKKVTPFRMGMVMAELGHDTIPNPYREGTRGHNNYREGLAFGISLREEGADQ